MYINVYSGLKKNTYSQGWTIVDEPLTGTAVSEAIYKNAFKGEITFPEGKWTPNGNLGIGTPTPKERLSVNGNVRAHEVKVETSGWPDYVFAEGYQLPSLQETALFIEKNKHLPDVVVQKKEVDMLNSLYQRVRLGQSLVIWEGLETLVVL